MKTYILKIFLAIFLVFVSAQANVKNNEVSVIIGETIGHALSNEQIGRNKKINVNIDKVQYILSKNMIARGFLLNSVNIYRYEKRGRKFSVFGTLVHTDSINRFIKTKFKAACIIKNKKNYFIKKLKLSNNTRPETVFFIVPKERIKIGSLKKLSFVEALRKVKLVARHLNSSDIKPKKYKIITFVFGKINEKDKVYSIISSDAYDVVGKMGDVIKTKDGWNILVADETFAYDGNDVKYLNVFWETNGYTVPIVSYSTQSLAKAIQISLQKMGYNIGYIDGKFNNRTIKAIKQYLKDMHFSSKSNIDENLLWFMLQTEPIDVSRTVQLSLLQHGINIGAIDGKVGPGTKAGLRKYQKKIGLKADGKMTPGLVRLLVRTSNILDVRYYVQTFFNKVPSMNRYEEKMWPNEL